MSKTIEILKSNPESIIGKIVSYNYGGSSNIEFVVSKYRIREEEAICDGEKIVTKYYSISPGGSGYYPVYKSNCVVVE